MATVQDAVERCTREKISRRAAKGMKEGLRHGSGVATINEAAIALSEARRLKQK